VLTVYSDSHRLHHGQHELIDGIFKPCFEMPSRADMVLARVREIGLGDVVDPTDFGRAPIDAVHAADYCDFLRDAWSEWTALGRTGDALPLVWPVPALSKSRVPVHIDGKLGYYSMDAGAPITAGTWRAVYGSAQVAVSAADRIAGGLRSAFALCRPPGHHAAANYMGGYCYLNNAAIAAQHLIGRGAQKILILDVDYHHGNGTQSIFYERDDVSFISLHADPATEYPYFSGYAHETGGGRGLGHNHNLPLPAGAAWHEYRPALESGCRIVREYRPDALVVSLGVDTFEKDPISRFRLRSEDYVQIGRMVAGLRCPVMFVLEGGYAVDDIGVNVVNVLSGYEQDSR
jgi:acetoin utilization deacetylase AcuC-like enzyme